MHEDIACFTSFAKLLTLQHSRICLHLQLGFASVTTFILRLQTWWQLSIVLFYRITPKLSYSIHSYNIMATKHTLKAILFIKEVGHRKVSVWFQFK